MKTILLNQVSIFNKYKDSYTKEEQTIISESFKRDFDNLQNGSASVVA